MLIPVLGELATVAPVMAHVNRVTAQLSAVVGFAVATDPEQLEVEVLQVALAGHVMVGLILSVTVKV